MDIKAVVGRNVKQYREAKGFSQEQLAFEANLHPTYVSAVERRVRKPTVLIVAKPAMVLGEEPCKLLKLNG